MLFITCLCLRSSFPVTAAGMSVLLLQVRNGRRHTFFQVLRIFFQPSSINYIYWFCTRESEGHAREGCDQLDDLYNVVENIKFNTDVFLHEILKKVPSPTLAQQRVLASVHLEASATVVASRPMGHREEALDAGCSGGH